MKSLTSGSKEIFTRKDPQDRGGGGGKGGGEGGLYVRWNDKLILVHSFYPSVKKKENFLLFERNKFILSEILR